MTIKEVREDYNRLNMISEEWVRLQNNCPSVIDPEHCCTERIYQLNAEARSIESKYLKEFGMGYEIYSNRQMSGFIYDLCRFVASLDSEKDTICLRETEEIIEKQEKINRFYQEKCELDRPEKIKLEAGNLYIVHNLYGDNGVPALCREVFIKEISSNGKAAYIGTDWFLIEMIDVIAQI